MPPAGRLPAGGTWGQLWEELRHGGMPLRGDAAGAGGRGRLTLLGGDRGDEGDRSHGHRHHVGDLPVLLRHEAPGACPGPPAGVSTWPRERALGLEAVCNPPATQIRALRRDRGGRLGLGGTAVAGHGRLTGSADVRFRGPGTRDCTPSGSGRCPAGHGCCPSLIRKRSVVRIQVRPPVICRDFSR